MSHPTHVMRLETNETTARQLIDQLVEFFDPEEVAFAAFEKDDGPVWLWEAYFSKPPEQDMIRQLVRPILGNMTDNLSFESLMAQDWVKASLEGLKPVKAGRFVLHGQHDRLSIKPHDWNIEIEAALAFGTGHHGTTRGCLMAFHDVIKHTRPHHVLDVGTGTGVLAFAAAKALKQKVVAGDLDPVAVDVGKANARLNGLGAHLAFYAASGVQHPFSNRPGHFDLIFANILARPLMKLARSIGHVASRNATLILSGLLYKDVPGIVFAYRTQGFRLKKRYDLEGWSALVLKR